jgi:hypothetical protein
LFLLGKPAAEEKPKGEKLKPRERRDSGQSIQSKFSDRVRELWDEEADTEVDTAPVERKSSRPSRSERGGNNNNREQQSDRSRSTSRKRYQKHRSPPPKRYSRNIQRTFSDQLGNTR